MNHWQQSQTLNSKRYSLGYPSLVYQLHLASEPCLVASSFRTKRPFLRSRLSATSFLQSQEIFRCQTRLSFFYLQRAILSARPYCRQTVLLNGGDLFGTKFDSSSEFFERAISWRESSSGCSGDDFSRGKRSKSYFWVSGRVTSMERRLNQSTSSFSGSGGAQSCPSLLESIRAVGKTARSELASYSRLLKKRVCWFQSTAIYQDNWFSSGSISDKKYLLTQNVGVRQSGLDPLTRLLGFPIATKKPVPLSSS